MNPRIPRVCGQKGEVEKSCGEGGKPLECAWCHAKKQKMTIWIHKPSGTKIALCFHGCQFIPEPFEQAVENGSWEEWERVDPWQRSREKPGLKQAVKKTGSGLPKCAVCGAPCLSAGHDGATVYFRCGCGWDSRGEQYMAQTRLSQFTDETGK